MFRGEATGPGGGWGGTGKARGNGWRGGIAKFKKEHAQARRKWEGEAWWWWWRKEEEGVERGDGRGGVSQGRGRTVEDEPAFGTV